MSITDADSGSWEVTSGFVSSNINGFRYDKSTDTLRIDFMDGSSYEYYNVPPQTHRAFQAAASKGEFLVRHIKGRFNYERV